MDAFTAWNLFLLRTFFSPASSGEQVWLSLDPDELDAIAPQLGGDQGLLAAVRAGPAYLPEGKADFTGLAERLCELRRSTSPQLRGYVDPGSLAAEYAEAHAPSYLPILAALTRNSAAQEDTGYYQLLRAELELPDSWSTGDMKRLDSLWSDLAEWTREMNGRFGLFTYRRLGSYRYVGIPRSQVIISRRDARALTRVFAQVGITSGQATTPRIVDDIIESARGMAYLSRPFRQALEQLAFREPIRERVLSILEDWDGLVVGATSLSGSTPEATNEVALGDLEVALGLERGNVMPWQVRWRVPALRDVGSIRLQQEHAIWNGSLAGTEAVTTEPAEENTNVAARALLARSATEDVTFDVMLERNDEAEPTLLSRVVLRRRALRFLVGINEFRAGVQSSVLVERPLPMHGPAYLLASVSTVGLLQKVVRENRIQHEACPADGLPEGWKLFYLPRCEDISDAQRAEMPDGDAPRSLPRTLRLVGGRPIHRGGVRQYLSFDLPTVELDAPEGTEIEPIPGLRLNPQAAYPESSQVTQGVARIATIKRFAIEVIDVRAHAFELRAAHLGEVLDKVRLRIAPESGLNLAKGAVFALDPRGHPQSEGVGLRGVLSDADATLPCRSAESALPVDLGWPLHVHDSVGMRNRPAARFLHTLSQAGAMSLGPARDQLFRLLGPDLHPYDLLRDLRGRGFLEIEANSKGHWTRVHMVPPFLSILPVRSSRGPVVAALGGTLPLQQWDNACAAAAHDVTPMRDVRESHLPTVWIVAKSRAALDHLAATMEVRVVDRASERVATWAAAIEDVRSELMTAGVESLGGGTRHVERFMPAQGRFVAPDTRMALVPGPTTQLFQVEDMETGSHWIYVLGFRTAAEHVQYSFVRDSRWGVWIALGSLAKWAQTTFARDDLYPWPIHYDKVGRILWLPKRLSLPMVLERALLLCSGASPVEERLCRMPATSGVGLSRYGNGRGLGVVSDAYREYVPQYPASAQWLGYRWIPQQVAQEVARKVGATLHPLVAGPTLA